MFPEKRNRGMPVRISLVFKRSTQAWPDMANCFGFFSQTLPGHFTAHRATRRHPSGAASRACVRACVDVCGCGAAPIALNALKCLRCLAAFLRFCQIPNPCLATWRLSSCNFSVRRCSRSPVILFFVIVVPAKLLATARRPPGDYAVLDYHCKLFELGRSRLITYCVGRNRESFAILAPLTPLKSALRWSAHQRSPLLTPAS